MAWYIVRRIKNTTHAIPQPYVWDRERLMWVRKQRALLEQDKFRWTRFETQEEAENAAMLLAVMGGLNDHPGKLVGQLYVAEYGGESHGPKARQEA